MLKSRDCWLLQITVWFRSMDWVGCLLLSSRLLVEVRSASDMINRVSLA
jgi:hypothetical protein